MKSWYVAVGVLQIGKERHLGLIELGGKLVGAENFRQLLTLTQRGQ